MASIVTTAAELLERYDQKERDFRGAKLAGADLAQADLSNAVLIFADLSHANLAGADLTMANLVSTKLTGANLERTVLNSADFAMARMEDANLTLSRANRLCLQFSRLDRARLADTYFNDADLSRATLDGADLTRATLNNAVFFETLLKQTQWLEATLSNAAFINVDLSTLISSQLVHRGASTVDYRSILRSLHAYSLPQFLRDIGMPEVFVQYSIDCAKSLSPDMVFSLLRSTFISYGGPDQDFARRLNKALRREGVTTFFFEDDAIPGDELQAMVRRGVNDHDRVILVCSEASLNRGGLLNELKETLRREARDGGRSYLIPIVLDDYPSVDTQNRQLIDTSKPTITD